MKKEIEHLAKLAGYNTKYRNVFAFEHFNIDEFYRLVKQDLQMKLARIGLFCAMTVLVALIFNGVLQ